MGGSLKDNLNVVDGLKTLPALSAYGNPSAPITSNFGSHPLPSKALKGLVVTLFTPFNNGNGLIASCWSSLAVSYSYLYLFGGTSTVKLVWISPVFESSILSNKFLKILIDDGTIPDASPEWTPYFNTSTLTLQQIIPLKELVNQKVS